MKRIIYLGIAVLVVILLWSGAWLFISDQVKKNVEALALADGIINPRITCGTLSVSGFPFHFDADCTNATLILADTTANLAELRASVLVYRPTHLLAFAKGPATLTDAFTGSSNRLDWTKLEASVRLDGWRIGRISLTGDNLALNDTVMTDKLIASATALEIHLLDIPERHEQTKGLAAVALYGKATALNAPGFDIAAGDTSVEAEIDGIPDDIRLLGEPDALSRWQKSGGKVQIVALKGNDGDKFFDSTGTLGLDDQAHVEGQVKLTSKGIAEIVGPQIPSAVRPMVLGPEGVDGTYAQTFNIRSGLIISGVIPLGMIPPLY